MVILPIYYISAQNWEVSVIPQHEDAFFTENYEVRAQVKDFMFSPMAQIKTGDEYYSLWDREYKVKFETTIKNDAAYFQFKNESKRGYDNVTRGNYIIKRSLKNGIFQWIKVLLRDEQPHSYIRILSDGNRSLLELYFFDTLLYQNIILPVSLETLITAPFSKIIQFTEGSIDWSYILSQGYGKNYLNIRLLIERLLELLPYVTEAYDGAINQRGEFVLIKGGELQGANKGVNCSGFSKWMIDGFYFALTDKYIDIELLKIKHQELRGNRWIKRYEDQDEYDPFFGLDWSRNLAIVLMSARTGREIKDIESFDVREVDFFTYTEDIGYRVKDLRLLLYYLAVNEPGYFYLGSVNSEYKDNPFLRQHFHIVVLLPYFDDDGFFHIVVMDQHKDTDIDALIEKFEYDFIHLVSLEAKGKFEPFIFE